MAVYVKNVDKLINKIDKMMSVNLTEPLNEACLLVENEARINCPVGKTGELRNSITHEVIDNVGIVGSNMTYAPYVEYGTGVFAAAGNGRQDRWCYKDAEGNWWSTIGQEPQPFLEPALAANRVRIEQILNDYIKKEFSKC